MNRRPPTWLRDFVRTVSWHRRLLAGGLAAGAVALAIHAVEPATAPTTTLIAAARDVPGGSVLTASDLRTIDVATEVVPSGAVTSTDMATGQRVAGPIRDGEIITDVRLVTTALLEGWGADVAAVPVRIADAAAVQLVKPGDHIDILAAPTSGEGDVTVVAAAVPVLSTPAAEPGGALAEGGLVVVAAGADQAGSLAAASVTARLSLALRQ
jgi:pilus assembly protein CpaB